VRDMENQDDGAVPDYGPRTALTAHTPGPWRTQGWVPTWAYIPVKDASHNLVASLYPYELRNYTREQVEANARLIAAAPDMLDVLDRFSKFPFAHQGIAEGPLAVMIKQARAAIAKATGGQ
jgi:hypothetical protein